MNFSSTEKITENLFTVSDKSQDRTARCSIPIRGRDPKHTNKQSTEYSTGHCRHCTVQNKSTTCCSKGIRQWRKVLVYCILYWCQQYSRLYHCWLLCLIKIPKINEWVRPTEANTQHTHPEWIILWAVKGDWKFTTRQPMFDVVNSPNIKCSLRTFCRDIYSTFCFKIFIFKVNFRTFLSYSCKLYWWYDQIPD